MFNQFLNNNGKYKIVLKSRLINYFYYVKSILIIIILIYSNIIKLFLHFFIVKKFKNLLIIIE